jgi:hypothetical protein
MAEEQTYSIYVSYSTEPNVDGEFWDEEGEYTGPPAPEDINESNLKWLALLNVIAGIPEDDRLFLTSVQIEMD